MRKDYAMNVLDRFLTYVSFHTTSSEDSATVPSTERQLRLAEHLVSELNAIGLERVTLDRYGRVYAFLPGNVEGAEPLGFIAHMDTSPDASGENVKPRIIKYEGGDAGHIKLSDFPSLGKCVGEELVITDGTTLLGADDKAGIAEIVTAAEYLKAHPELKHRGMAICFTPDEEIGCGADHFDFSRFPAKAAYTVDGGELGELEYENFNAASAVVTVHGVNIHPGEAKNKMKNAVLMAVEFVSRMPAAETPAHTEGYEGFYHVSDIEGNETLARVAMIIRDHDAEKFAAKKRFVEELCAYLNGVYGEGSFELTLKDSYYNMKEKILPHMELVHNAEAAFKAAGVEPKIVPIRGGTDGARLSYEGLPCPNLSTGGVNFHGVHEYIPVSSLEKMVQVILALVKC